MKKIRFLILGLSAVLCIAVFVNWDRISSGVNKKTDTAIGSETYVLGENYFESAKYSRDRVRNETVSALKEIISDEKADEESKKTAENDISFYAKAAETESSIENLVKAKGFSECVAFVGKDNVSVVVENKLTAEDAAKITDIAIGQTGFEYSAIKIIELASEKSQ